MIESEDCVDDNLTLGNNLDLRYELVDLNLQNQK